MSDVDPTPPPTPQQGFVAELVDAIAQRTFFLVVGVLFIQLAFVFSYVGAFHKPEPHRIPVIVAAPAQFAPDVAKLNALPGAPLQVTLGQMPAALTALRHGATDGVLVVDTRTTKDTMYVAGGGGAAVVSALEQIVGAIEAKEHRTATFVDAVPAQSGDARGLSGFYLVIGWLIGGYLAAALLSIAHGARPSTPRRAVIRLIALGIYAVVSGITGALVVGPLLCALTGHFLGLFLMGTLLVFAAAAVTMAFQAVAGVLGIGLTVILFVVLGNPSAGGAYPKQLLPGFWRAISSYIPNGAGVQAVRHIVYFGGHGIAGSIVVILIYALLGVTVAVGTAVLRARHGRAPAAESAAA